MGKIKGKLTLTRVLFSLLAMVLISGMAFASMPGSTVPSIVNLPGTMNTNSINTFLARVDTLDEQSRIPIQDLKLFIYDDSGDVVAWVKFDFWGNIIGGSGHITNVNPSPARNLGFGWGYGEGEGEETIAWGYGHQPHYGYQEVDGGWIVGTQNFIAAWPGEPVEQEYGFYYPSGWDNEGPPILNQQQFNNILTYGYGYFLHYWYYEYGYGYGYGQGWQYLPDTQWLVTFHTGQLPPGDYTAMFSVDVPPEPKQFTSGKYPFEIVTAPGGGGGGGYRPDEIEEEGPLNIDRYLGFDGKTWLRVCIISPDSKAKLCIPLGTWLGFPQGADSPHYMEIELLSTPPSPEGYQMVGRAYDFIISDTEFDPYAEVFIDYTEGDIPAGASESDLVIAYHDGTEWVFLTTDINTVANYSHAEVEHLTPFALFAPVPVEEEEVPPPPAPPAPPEEPAPTPAPPTPAPAPTPAPPAEEAPAGVSWWLIGGIIVGVVVIGGLIFLMVRRRAG